MWIDFFFRTVRWAGQCLKEVMRVLKLVKWALKVVTRAECPTKEFVIAGFWCSRTENVLMDDVLYNQDQNQTYPVRF